MSKKIAEALILEQSDYQPGDPAPEGYLAWHEWATTQQNAGLKQAKCGKCGLWKYPQELSGQLIRWTAQSRKGPVTCVDVVCKKCAPIERIPHTTGQTAEISITALAQSNAAIFKA